MCRFFCPTSNFCPNIRHKMFLLFYEISWSSLFPLLLVIGTYLWVEELKRKILINNIIRQDRNIYVQKGNKNSLLETVEKEQKRPEAYLIFKYLIGILLGKTGTFMNKKGTIALWWKWMKMSKRPETSFILLSIRSINGQNRNISEQNGNETSLLGLGIIEKKQEGLKTISYI